MDEQVMKQLAEGEDKDYPLPDDNTVRMTIPPSRPRRRPLTWSRVKYKLKEFFRYRNWSRWFKTKWYKYRHGIIIEPFEGTMLPSLGKGKFVSVYRKGDYIDIIAHRPGGPQVKRIPPDPSFDPIPVGTIRLIPCQHNHGVMVEWLDEGGEVCGRTHCDYDMFWRMLGKLIWRDIRQKGGA